MDMDLVMIWVGVGRVEEGSGGGMSVVVGLQE